MFRPHTSGARSGRTLVAHSGHTLRERTRGAQPRRTLGARIGHFGHIGRCLERRSDAFSPKSERSAFGVRTSLACPEFAAVVRATSARAPSACANRFLPPLSSDPSASSNCRDRCVFVPIAPLERCSGALGRRSASASGRVERARARSVARALGSRARAREARAAGRPLRPPGARLRGGLRGLRRAPRPGARAAGAVDRTAGRAAGRSDAPGGRVGGSALGRIDGRAVGVSGGRA